MKTEFCTYIMYLFVSPPYCKCVSENYNAEKVRVGVGICVHPRSDCQSPIGDLKIKIEKHVTLTGLSHNTMSLCACFQNFTHAVTVAMIAMMKKHTNKTLSNMTMSMMTTVVHRDVENEWSICVYSGWSLVFTMLLLPP